MGDIITVEHIDQFKVGNLHSGVDTGQFDDNAHHALGALAFGKDGKAYRYVQFKDSVTYASGHVCTFASATEWHVTNDRSGGSAITGHGVAGVVLGAPTTDQYGWIQVAGFVAAAGTYSAGDLLKPHASNDGQLVVSGYTAAKVDFNIVAYALSDSLVKLIGLV